MKALKSLDYCNLRTDTNSNHQIGFRILQFEAFFFFLGGVLFLLMRVVTMQTFHSQLMWTEVTLHHKTQQI